MVLYFGIHVTSAQGKLGPVTSAHSGDLGPVISAHFFPLGPALQQLILKSIPPIHSI